MDDFTQAAQNVGSGSWKKIVRYFIVEFGQTNEMLIDTNLVRSIYFSHISLTIYSVQNIGKPLDGVVTTQVQLGHVK